MKCSAGQGIGRLLHLPKRLTSPLPGAYQARAVRHLVSQMWMQRSEKPLIKALLAPLWFISLFVALAARARRARLPAKAHRAQARVISVGNLTVGGAGKTPVTIAIARRLLSQGRRVAVLSRGYGRKGRGPLVVSDGASIHVSAEMGGDEPIVIANALAGVPVLVGPERADLAVLATERFGAEVLLLDDGFQHFKLARDVDVVLVDGSNPFGNGHVMPRGPLREPRSALRSADLAWITKVESAPPGEVEVLAAELEAMTGRPAVFSATRVCDIADLAGVSLGKAALNGARAFLACGLARPEAFRRTVASMPGTTIVGEALFDDHHAFTRAELRAIRQRAAALGATAIAITAKDAAKLQALALSDGTEDRPPCRVVHIDLEIVSGAALLDEVLSR